MFLAQSCINGLYHVLTRSSGNAHVGSTNSRDAWAKHKDVESYEAKWLYVDALLKVSLMPINSPSYVLIVAQVLRKYSDKTVARDLVQELESFAGDPSNIMMSRMSH